MDTVKQEDPSTAIEGKMMLYDTSYKYNEFFKSWMGKILSNKLYIYIYITVQFYFLWVWLESINKTDEQNPKINSSESVEEESDDAYDTTIELNYAWLDYMPEEGSVLKSASKSYDRS